MKNWLMLPLLLCFLGVTAFAEIDPIVARVKLTKVEVITQRQFKKQVDDLEEKLKKPFTAEQRKNLLDALVDNKILLQAADRAKIPVSQLEVNAMLDVYKQNLGVQAGLNRKLTDSEMEQLLSREGLGLDKLVDQLRDQIKMEKFISEEKKDLFSGIAKPTEEEVREFYEANRTRYPIVSPEMVSFKHIVMMTKSLTPADQEKAKLKADEIYRQLQGGVSFDKFLEVYLESTGSRKVGGLAFETWRRDDANNRAGYGKTFFDEMFKMKAGERSKVLTSNIGYHIVEIIEQIPFQVLGLNDKIPPKNTATIREYIESGLMRNKQQQVLQRATLELLNDLKKEADIQLFEKNLTW